MDWNLGLETTVSKKRMKCLITCKTKLTSFIFKTSLHIYNPTEIADSCHIPEVRFELKFSRSIPQEYWIPSLLLSWLLVGNTFMIVYPSIFRLWIYWKDVGKSYIDLLEKELHFLCKHLIVYYLIICWLKIRKLYKKRNHYIKWVLWNKCVFF